MARILRTLLLGVALASLASVVSADGTTAEDFACQLCRDSVRELVHDKTQSPVTSWDGLRALVRDSKFCDTARSGIFNPCDVLVPALEKLPARASSASLLESPRAACVQLSLCHKDLILRPDGATSSLLSQVRSQDEPIHDMRIALAHGSRGYDYVRISYIDNVARNHSDAFMDFFTYNEPFKYVWTEKWLHSTVVPISSTSPTTTFSIGVDYNITIRMPAKGKAVRGFVVADPCFNGDYVGCRHGKEFAIFDRLTQLLNIGLTKDVDTWMLIGDNFYDPHGVLAPQFMQALTVAAKSQPMIAVPGNHDFWQHGSPHSKTGYDTYGNGYMQYWTTDSQAAVDNEKNGSHVPFDFRFDPSTKHVAEVRNFFTYNMIGSLGVITFSGAHHKDVSDPLFQEACQWVKSVNASYVFVLGHWSDVGLGCEKEMDTRDVHKRIVEMPGCKEIAHRVKWFEGHQHCNRIVQADTGFRVAGFGMGGCMGHTDPNFGIPFFDITDEGHLQIGYFPIVGGNGTVPAEQEGANCAQDITWDTLINCIQANGLKGCLHLAVTWHEQDL